MNHISGYRGNIRLWLKGYLFIGVAVLILAVLFYSNHIISRMEEQSEATTRLFSRFIADVVLQVQDVGKRELLQEVLREIKLPIIFSDADGRPLAWHRVGIPEPSDEEFATLLSIDPKDPPPGKIKRLVEMAADFDEANSPVPVRLGVSGNIQGYVHFGASELQRELRLMPLIQLGIFLVFMGVGLLGFRYLKLSEQRSIWIGMAKETAHQLGTPLSALLGWTQILKDKINEGKFDEVSLSLGEMEEDLNRLNKVTGRFSKIGSRPELTGIDIAPVLERTVSYFHRRLPSIKADSTISIDVGEIPKVEANEELLEWVLENLFKNGLDALGEGGGRIQVSTKHDASKQCVDIYIRDTGRGVPAVDRERIFSPGFTTKKRGWGLGLTLAKRIIEEYHGGELKLVESKPGKWTTFLIRLPVA
ncbi:MAG: two-component sensor histidine kinase [Candidatus Latescibacteria bacterium]|nr:two-component sensor histidine kinase [Candidatus Latescibacterota bacterium]NIM22323.1 two-component sensor histidine kinase [Candidatus Latescibacterota bacterium]NIM66152.1 two-component sensor histidine kinase [Candidatus Latescibacterota bacterium]NIO02560.1 two-component sensor histidine kinase [Candidatus Latescibacterota bacterium]NIO29474.1 two-component sensor histidine kinase [Candidatus Latescibacterota bacterium]